MRRAWVTLLSLTLALGAASSADAAAWLTPPETVSAGGTDAVEPLEVAVDPGKDIFLAWTRDPFVEVGVRPAGGSFSVVGLFGCPTGFICSSAHDADIAVDADGNSVVVFVLDGRLNAFVRPAGGTYMQLPEVTPAQNVRRPRVAFMSDGTAIVVWRQESAGLFAAERPPGGFFGPPIPIYDETSTNEKVIPDQFELATGGDGNAIVAFVTSLPILVSGRELQSIFRGPGGWEAPQLIESEVAPVEMDCSRSVGFSTPAVALDDAANAVIAIQIQRSESGPACPNNPFPQTKIVAAHRPAARATWTSTPAEFDSNFASFVHAPVVALTSGREALVAWVRTISGTGSARYTTGPAAGDSFAPPASVPGSNTVAGEGLAEPALAPLAGGDAMLAFIRQTSMDWSIEYARRPSGAPFGNASSATRASKEPSGLDLDATPDGDAVATWLHDDDAGVARVRSLIYDASPPSIGTVTVPASGAAGQQLAMSASANDAFSPVTFNWAFGDGSTGAGPATTHSYGAAGSFDATVNAVDAAGNGSSVTRRIAISGSDGTPDFPDGAPDFLGGLDLANARLRAAAKGDSAIPSQRRRRRAPIGTRVSFRLSEAASVRFTVERARPGRRVRGRCVKLTRRNSKRRKCTRYVRQRGSFTVAAAAGETRFRFTGRLRGRKLRPGRYRLVAVATDGGGNSSPPERARFTIVR